MGLWQNRSVRALLLSRNVSRLGDRFTTVAVAALAIQVAHASPAIVTLVFAAMLLPPVIVGWCSGSIVDRLPRRSLMMASDIGRAILVLVLAFLQGLDPILVTLLVMGIGTSLYGPAYTSLLPLAAGGELLEANALSQTVATVIDVAGYAVAGLAVVLFPLSVSFAIDALTYVLSAVFLLGLPLGRERAAARLSLATLLADARVGLQAVRRSRLGRRLLAQMSWACLGIGAANGLFVLLLTETLHGSMGLYGLMLAIQGLAMTGIGVVLAKIVRRVGQDTMVKIGLAATGIVIVAMGLATGIVWLAVFYALLGIANMSFLVPLLTLFQQSFDDAHRGRAQAFYTVAVNAALFISTVASGYVAQAVGIPATIAASGFFLISAAPIGMRLIRKGEWRAAVSSKD